MSASEAQLSARGPKPGAVARRGIWRPSVFATDLVFASILGALLAAIPLLVSATAYYNDDMRTEFMPIFYAIGKTLRSGNFVPLLTLHSWIGGNLIGDYQNNLFNPVALLLFTALPSFSTLSGGAAFLGLAGTAIWTPGTYLLARNLGISRIYSWVAAIAIATNSFVFYWLASSWFPGFISLALLTWAMAFLLRAHTSGGNFLGAAMATALVVTSGYPHTIIVGALISLIFVALVLRDRRAGDSLISLCAVSLGFFAGIVAIVALFDDLQGAMARQTGLFNYGFLVPSFGDAVSVSNPFYSGRMLGWYGLTPISVTTFYAAWFIVPIAALLDWSKVDWRSRSLLGLVILVCVLLFMTQGPEQIGPLRWPFRFLPYFQIILVLLSLLLLTRAGFAPYSRRRALVLGLVLAADMIHGIQGEPVANYAIFVIVPALVIAVGAGFMWYLRRPMFVAIVMLTLSIVFVQTTRTVLPRNPLLPDWKVDQRALLTESLWTIPNSYELDDSSVNVFLPRHSSNAFALGHDGLLTRQMINGYSGTQQRGLRDFFCLEIHGYTCPRAGVGLLSTEPVTRTPYADLMRVSKVVVERGVYLEQFTRAVRSSWHATSQSTYSMTFEQPLAASHLPGSLSWPFEGVTATEIGTPTPTKETLAISHRSLNDNRLVFARTWWPGYTATFNGVAVPVTALSGFLVSVALPANGEPGTLVLSYLPPGFWIAAGISIAALLAILAVSLFHRRISGWIANLNSTRADPSVD